MEYHISSTAEFEKALSASREPGTDKRNTIVFAPGDYCLQQPIMLDERDAFFTLEGHGKVTLRGGCRLVDWQCDGEFLRSDVPEGVSPRMLIIDGTYRERARFPEAGMLKNLNTPENLRWLSSTKGGWNRPLTHAELTHMTVDLRDIPAGMDVANAEITVYHKWDESTVRVKSYDPLSGIIEFMTETAHPAGAFQSQGYSIWNTREGMTHPGQWYFDRSCQQLVYLPLPGEDAGTLNAWIPVAEHAILCHGCHDIDIRGFRVHLCAAPAEAVGLRAINAPGAVEVQHAERLRLENLEIAHVMGNGIKLIACRDLVVDHCKIMETGAGGIFTHECENEVITHNSISGIGRTSFSAIGIHCGWRSMLVYVQDGCPEENGTVLCAHNTIQDVPYCGITCNGGPHRIEYNRLSACMTVLHDGAAIYCSRGDRTILRGNYVFDIDCDLAYACYFDEQSRYCVLDGNIAVNVPTPILCHMSEDLFFYRNLFISDRGCRISMALSRHVVWRHNIVVCEGKLEFVHRAKTPHYRKTDVPLHDVFVFIQSIVFSRSGELVLLGDNPPPADPDLICLDPKLEVAADGRVALTEGSPLWNAGFPLPDARFAGVDAPEAALDRVTGDPLPLLS